MQSRNQSSGSNLGGLGAILGGLFGNSDAPYKDAMKQYQKYFQGAQNFQNPFFNAGQQGMGNYQNWLQGQQDPSAFLNKLMGGYQESPFAKNLQQQSMRAGQNAASAEGTLGSTPMMQQAQQNAGQIASADQNQWLQNALGINTQYGQGQQNLMQGGQNAANQLSSLFSGAAGDMGNLAYGKRAGKNQDFMSILSGLFSPMGSSGGQNNNQGGSGGGQNFLQMLLPLLMG